MSERRREFARQFVLNGGNGTKAAVMAGYSEADPSKAARRALLDAKVIAEIKRLSTINIGAWLPMAIGVLIELMADPTTPHDTRRKCAVDLLDRAGMAAPKGGVQVNVGVQVNGNEANALIGSIWDARKARGVSSHADRSDILVPMNAIMDAEQPALEHEPINPAWTSVEAVVDQGGGAVSSTGSRPAPSNYTSPSPPTIAKPAKSVSTSGQPEERVDGPRARAPYDYD